MTGASPSDARSLINEMAALSDDPSAQTEWAARVGLAALEAKATLTRRAREGRREKINAVLAAVEVFQRELMFASYDGSIVAASLRLGSALFLWSISEDRHCGAQAANAPRQKAVRKRNSAITSAYLETVAKPNATREQGLRKAADVAAEMKAADPKRCAKIVKMFVY
ncbi:MAG: hypothetical protein WCK65_05305 [Rhodospirillaceae bacterium]